MDILKEVLTAGFHTQTLTRGTQVIERPDWYQVISPNNLSPSANEVIHSVLQEDQVDRVIEETIAHYTKLGTAFKWCLSPYTKPAQMAKALEKYGFGSWPTRGMYTEVSTLQLTMPSQLTFESVTPANFDVFIDTRHQGWNPEQALSSEQKEKQVEDLNWNLRRSENRALFFLAFFDGEPAGTAGFFCKKNSAYFVGGNVLKPFRGRGVYRGLVSHRLRIASELGYRLIVTGARERTSAPILQKLGFQTACYDSVFQYGGILPE